MLQYYKEGKEINIFAVGEKGKVGQIVVLTQAWPISVCPDDMKRYQNHPHFFIIKSVDIKDRRYVFVDPDGNEITVRFDAAEVFDAKEWADFCGGKQEKEVRDKNESIRILKMKLDLLREILMEKKSPIIIVNKDQAELLETMGINI